MDSDENIIDEAVKSSVSIDDQTSQKKSKTVLIVVSLAIVTFICFAAYFFLGNNLSTIVPEVTDTTMEDPYTNAIHSNSDLQNLKENPGYAAGISSYKVGHFQVSAEQFKELALETPPGDDYAQILLREAIATEKFDPFTSIDLYKEVVAYTESSNTIIKASALEHLVQLYKTNSSREIFERIFSGDPYESFLADEHASPSQVDASLTNLLEYGASIHPTAAIELTLASDKANAHVPLSRKAYTTCNDRLPYKPDPEIDRTYHFCVADLSKLTEEEKNTFIHIRRYGNARLKNAEREIELMRSQNANTTLIAVALSKRASVLGKMLIFGVGVEPDANGKIYTREQMWLAAKKIEELSQEAIAYAREHEVLSLEATTRLNLAIFLRTFYTLEDGMHEKIRDLVSVFYDSNKYHNTGAAKAMRSAYQTEQDGHSITTGMTVRGPARISEIDADFRSYLESLGWDYESEAVTMHLGVDVDDKRYVTTGPVDWVE